MMKIDQLNVYVFPNRLDMGRAAAAAFSVALRQLLEKQEKVRTIFAAAPSQNEFLAALVQEKNLEWQRVEAFHMDEYIGLPKEHPAGFGYFLRERLFNLLPFGRVEYIDITATDPHAECGRYASLLAEGPIDLVALGIGENGHIAFNDPPVADFNDPAAVKVVQLEEACRQQQVNDGCFQVLSAVPEFAVTLTIPTLMQAGQMVCIVPGPRKAAAVKAALEDPIGVHCPATILRTHGNAGLYLDQDAANNLLR